MLIFFELTCQLFEEMLFSTEIFWDDTQNINITIIAICLQSKTTKNLHSKTHFLEVNLFIISFFCYVFHPFVNNFL